jgi:pyrimidine operon attenuation protein/uracil phosphoribosyltransferase
LSFGAALTRPVPGDTPVAMSEVLLDPKAIAEALRRMAGEIATRDASNPAPLALIAIRRGGELPARVMADHIASSRPVLRGAVDITLYRDDAATALPNLRVGPSHIPFDVEGTRVVLVDDVVSSGRTVRAAIDAVLDYGRPLRIELAALIDRGGRELPIQPDYTGLACEVAPGRRVEVVLKTVGPGPEGDEPWALVVPSPPPRPRPSRAGTVGRLPDGREPPPGSDA